VGLFWDEHAVACVVLLVFAPVCLRVAASWDDLPVLLTAGHIGAMLLAQGSSGHGAPGGSPVSDRDAVTRDVSGHSWGLRTRPRRDTDDDG
jgi:hypothetical protein